MFKKFISYYKPHLGMFSLDMLASLFVSVIAMIYPIITRTMINDYIPNENIKMIIYMGGLLFLLYFIRMFLKYFVQYYGHVIGVKMQANMRRDMFMKLESLPFNYYDTHETGRIMSRLVNDLQQVSELAHHGPENLFICGFMVVGSFVYLCTINWMLTLIIFLCVPVLAVLSIFMRKRMSQAFTATRKKTAVINANVESSITGIRVTKAFNNANEELRKFDKGNNEFVKERSIAYKRMGEFGASTGFVTDLFNIVVLVAGGIFLMQGKINFADFSAFILSINLFITPLITMINFVETFEDGVSGFRRFYEIMNLDEEKDAVNPVSIDRLSGDISFNNVTFSYEIGRNILDNFSLDIKQGQKIALVGPSGGGKTTICHLIPRFYNITSGELLLDNINIDNIKNFDLRKNIGIVQQDVFLFNGTIYENVLYGKLDATEDEVVEACKKARIHDDILNMSDGYNTIIGERGVKLSGGQKQRLSIARVFLKNPSILILDEATSALDNTTEMLIESALDDLSKNRTTIVVAHRLSTIFNSDVICVINDGKLIEKGNHEELIAKDGVYARLYEASIKNNKLERFIE